MRPFARTPYSELPLRPKRAHSFLELPLQFIEVRSEPFGKTRVAYRKTGSGPPLLLLHGLMTSAYSFRYIYQPLSERFTLYIPDLLGHGDSDKPTGPDAQYRAPELARWLGAVLQALGILGCQAVANSLGGYVSMWLALLRPDALCRLVNLHSPGVPEPRLVLLEKVLQLPGAQRLLAKVAGLSPQRWVWFNVHYFDESIKSREETKIYAAPLSSAQGAAAFSRIMAQVLSVPDLHEFGARLQARTSFPCPLMMIYSRQDPMVPPKVGEKLAAMIPDARMVWLESTSHFMHVDSPQRVLPHLNDFLKTAPPT